MIEWNYQEGEWKQFFTRNHSRDVLISLCDLGRLSKRLYCYRGIAVNTFGDSSPCPWH